MGIMAHHRFGGAFDQIRQLCVGKALAQGGNGRSGEDDIADEAKSDEQNL